MSEPSSWTSTTVPGLRSRPARHGPSEDAVDLKGDVETAVGTVRVDCYWMRWGMVWSRWIDWQDPDGWWYRDKIADEATPEEIEEWVRAWVEEITGEEGDDA